MISFRYLCLVFMVFLTVVIFAYVSVAEEGNTKTIQAIRIEADEAPVMDGKLDDVCWKKAHKVTDFIQFEPALGENPKDPTVVCIMFDRENLYVGFECFKKHPDQVLGSQMKRDSHFFQDDYVEIFLDTYCDHRNCYGFAVNCLGTQVDRRIANEGSMRSGGPRGDRSRAWDCTWESKAVRTDRGWTAEMAIPFSEMRFDKKGDGTWGINFWRSNEEYDAEDTWADVGDKELAVSRFGTLEGLTPEDLVASRPLEFKPYVAAKPEFSPEQEMHSDAGVDIRYPSSTVTLDLTLKPDFAQVEADPDEVNLEDVERRLTEKRPFFQEGMELFQTPIELFYTRRVGIEDLKYGAKAVGKLGSYNMALLGCQSDDTAPVDEEEEVDEEPEDETKNNYFVFRTQRDVGASSSIGFLGINKQKADGYNRLGSIDVNTTLPADTRLTGQYAGSWRQDKRDDAFIVDLSKRTQTTNLHLTYSDVGTDFDAQSGFIPRIDRRGFRGRTRYEYRRDSNILRSIEGGVQYERLENHKGVRTNEARGIEVRSRLSDFFISIEPEWYYHVSEDYEDIFYTDRTVSFFTGWFPPRWASVRSRMFIGKQEDKDTFYIGPSVDLVPTKNLRLELELDRMDKEGERLEFNRRIGITYQFNHQMFFRSTLQVTRNDERNVFALYGWEYRPESTFYVVYSDRKAGDITDRLMFVKLSYSLKWKIF